MSASVTRIRAALVAALVALVVGGAGSACSRARHGDGPSPDRGRPIGNTGGAVPRDAAAPAIDAPVVDPACVAACVRARQMEAVAIELIEQGCARQCASPPPPALP